MCVAAPVDSIMKRHVQLGLLKQNSCILNITKLYFSNIILYVEMVYCG